MRPAKPVKSWRTRRSPRLIILPVCVFAACSLVNDPAVTREPTIGTIAFYSDSTVIEVPDSVRVGVPFPVTVLTYGDGCTARGGTDVEIIGLGALVTPYDTVPAAGQNVACTLMLKQFDHVVQLTFLRSGTATIRVNGRREPGHEVITVVRTVVVK